jgi:tetratricopeptide (TPR) repeat protein
LPVIKANAFGLSVTDIRGKAERLTCLILLTLLAIIPFISLKTAYGNPPGYPVSYKNLPRGITLFLNHVGVGGLVLNHPNNGGYLQWMIYPRYRILMDMEVPFLFTDEDFYVANGAFANDMLLQDVIVKYDPSFIVVPISNIKFKEMIRAFTDYKAVFFDDTEVLYVNSRQHPSVADTYGLNAIDPFMLTRRPMDALKDEGDMVPALKELLRIRAIYPDCGIVNQLLAMIYNKKGEFEKAIPYEDAIINNYPDLPTGFRLKADSLRDLNLFEGAITHYYGALEKSDVRNREECIHINKEIGQIYLKQKQYNKAYAILNKSINIFSPETSYKDIYYVGLAAFMSGRIRTAKTLYEYGYVTVPVDFKEWQDRFQRLKSMIEGADKG